MSGLHCGHAGESQSGRVEQRESRGGPKQLPTNCKHASPQLFVTRGRTYICMYICKCSCNCGSIKCLAAQHLQLLRRTFAESFVYGRIKSVFVLITVLSCLFLPLPLLLLLARCCGIRIGILCCQTLQWKLLCGAIDKAAHAHTDTPLPDSTHTHAPVGGSLAFVRKN